MDLSKKQASKMSLISLFQTLLSVIAFVFVTYILLNIDIVFESTKVQKYIHESRESARKISSRSV